MIIIGIIGGIGHGKSALGQAFTKVEPRSEQSDLSDIIIEVANAWQTHITELPATDDLASASELLTPLPEILRRIAHIPATPQLLSLDARDIELHPEIYEKLFLHLAALREQPALLRTHITRINKPQYRPILQWLGGYTVLRIDKFSWSAEAMRRAKAAEAHGTKLCVIGGLRFPSHAESVHSGGGMVIRVERSQAGEQDASDPTERERNKIPFDTTVINNAGLSELEAVARQIYADLRQSKLKKQYIASDVHS